VSGPYWTQQRCAYCGEPSLSLNLDGACTFCARLARAQNAVERLSDPDEDEESPNALLNELDAARAESRGAKEE
jgi:hypothetical protein